MGAIPDCFPMATQSTFWPFHLVPGSGAVRPLAGFSEHLMVVHGDIPSMWATCSEVCRVAVGKAVGRKRTFKVSAALFKVSATNYVTLYTHKYVCYI